MLEKVSFFSSGGIRLAGELYEPEALRPGGGCPALVLCQGLSGVKHKVLPEVARRFSAAGFEVLAFDYRGCGESEGDPTRLFPLERVDDALHAVAFMRSRRSVDPGRVGLYGLSYGGATALCAAAADRRVGCVAAVSGAVDGRDLMRGMRDNDDWISFLQRLEEDRAERARSGRSSLVPLSEILPFNQRFVERYAALEDEDDSESMPEARGAGAVPRFTLESAEAMTRFEVSAVVEEISPRPALFVQGELDDVVALEDAHKVYRRAGMPKEFVCLWGCDHIDLDSGPGFERQVELSRQWFERYL